MVDSLKNQTWVNEVNYEIAGVIVGDSNLKSEAPRKGRESAAQKVLHIHVRIYMIHVLNTALNP